MKTAVEWLEKVYSDACYNNMTHNIQISKDFIPNIIAKAKEIEKQQIIEAHLDGQCFSITIEEFDYAEQYYNKTFNK
jgi:hypothetical protein